MDFPLWRLAGFSRLNSSLIDMEEKIVTRRMFTEIDVKYLVWSASLQLAGRSKTKAWRNFNGPQAGQISDSSFVSVASTIHRGFHCHPAPFGTATTRLFVLVKVHDGWIDHEL